MADDFDAGVADFLKSPADPLPVAPRLKYAMGAAADAKPDYEAELARAAKVTGVPLESARADPRTALQQAEAVRLDLDGLTFRAPLTAGFLAEPGNARVAKDDTTALERVEQSLKNLGDLGKASFFGAAAGSAGALQAMSPGLRLLGVRDPLGLGEFDDPKSEFGRYVTALRQASKGASEHYMPKTDNPWAAGVNSGIVSIFQNAPLTAAAVATKNPGVALGMMGAITGGQGYGDAKDAGKSTGTALRYAGTQGAIEILTEKIPMSQLIGDVAKRTPFFQTLMKNIALEAPGEQIATLAQDFDEWVTLHPDKPMSAFLKERGNAAISTLVATALGSTSNVTVGKLAEVASRQSEKGGQAVEAQQQAVILEQLNEGAKGSKLRERDPAAFEAFVAQATKDGPVEHVYVDPRVLTELLAQGDGVALTDNAALMQSMPSLMPQMDQALALGQDVRIPVSEFAAYAAGSNLSTALIPHLKTDPAGMSLLESEAFLQTHGEELQAEVAKVVQAEVVQDEFSQSGDRVKEAIAQQLAAANRFTPDVNDAYSTLTAAFYATMAQRTGTTPEAMYEAHPLRIAAEGVTGSDVLSESVQQAPAGMADIRSPRAEYVQEVVSANFESGRVIGPQVVPIGDLSGGIVGGADDVARVADLKGKIASPDGYFERLIVDQDGNVVEGQHRLDALRELGATEVPIIRVQDDLANFPARRVKDAINAAATTHSDHVNQIVAQLAEIAAEEKNDMAEIRLWEAPRGFGKQWAAALDAMESALANREFEELAQGDKAPRGLYSPNTNLITLLKGADLSTFLHESGHFYLETLARLAASGTAPADLEADMQTVLDFMGQGDKTAAEWLATPLDQRRDGHELFARGFEAYLMEGKSPSQELRGLFQRFRAWLTAVYRTISKLDVELTPEVRGVFDRMLASEAQITTAAQSAGYAPLFNTAEEAGLTPDEWESYQRLGAEATQEAVSQLETRSIRDMKWLSGARDRTIRRLQREAATKRKAVQAEVEAELMRQPVNRARQLLKFGLLDGQEVEGPTKLSLPELREMYPGNAQYPGGGVDYKALGFGKYGMVAEDGIHPEQVAELVGFSSGDELVRALIAAPPLKDEIQGLTDQRMLERYGDLVDRDSIEEAADVALHNDARLRFVATEANALAKATGGRRVLAEAARGYAADLVGRQKIRDVKPSRYEAAESRAARAAEKAAKSGDLVAAATEKRNQMINGYAARAAYDAQDEVAKALRYFARFDSPGARKALDPEYRDQIDALLERFDLRKGVTLKDIDKRKSLAEWVERQQAMGLDPVIPDELLNDLSRKPYREMTVDELRGVVDSVRNIAHLGRLKNRLLTAKKNREFQAVVEEAEALIRDNATREARTAVESNRWQDKAESGVREFFAMHRKFSSLVRQMGGFKDDGLLWDVLVRPMNAASDREAVMRERSTKALHAALTPIIGEKLRAKVFIPEINTSLSLEGRLMVAMNWGNELNRARIMDGDQWNEAQVNAILATLTPEHLNVVQAVWDHIDTYWPEIAAKERRVSGVAPERVEASPVSVVASDGSTVELRGGYFPIKYDPARSTKAEADNIAELVKQSLMGAYTRATTRRGHTKKRVEKVERPVRKDFGVIFQHVGEVAHDLAWHEYLIDANRLLGSAGIDGAIRDHYGRETLNTMRKALEDMALGDIPAQNVFERGINHLRTGATIAGLGWNLVTSALQPIGLTQSMVRIGPQWVARGMSRWLRDAASMQNTVAWVNDRSDFMRLRGMTMQREINEVRNKVSSSLKPGALTAVEQSFFFFITKAQMVADMPTWLGQYEKSMEGGADEDTAVALADQAVKDSQGSGYIGDLSQIQRGGPLMKLWTNFYSFFNTTYNLLAESAAETRLAGPKRLPLLAADALLLIAIPSVLGTILKNALKGDDWEELPEKVGKDMLGFTFGLMVGMRELGGLITSDGRSNSPAGLRFMQEVAKLYTQASQGEVDESFLKALNNSAGILFHYPAGQVQRTVTGIQALANGETTNPLAPIVGPPPKN